MTKRHGVLFLFLSAHLLFALPVHLKETGLYSDASLKTVASSHLSYVPQYPLWSDGALKNRWIFLPENQKIIVKSAANNPRTGTLDHWLFPVGTKIWKEFSLRNAAGRIKKIETRLLEKISDEEWEVGTYLWNEAENDATLAPEDGILNYTKTAAQTSYDIPSVAECWRCHKRGGDAVLGFDAIQLSVDKDPLAPNAEPSKPNSWTLKRLLEENRLSDNLPEFKSGAPKIYASSPQGRAAFGYLHSNCASCHNVHGSFPHIGMNLRHSLKAFNETSEPAFLSVVDKFTTVFNFPGEAESYRVKRAEPQKSAVYRLMIEKTSHMPPLGANLPDEIGIQLLRDWISRL
jgi:hypothetical protein